MKNTLGNMKFHKQYCSECKTETLVRAVIAYVLGKKGMLFDGKYIDDTAASFIEWYSEIQKK